MKLETQAINLSLTALGNVLSALSRNAQFAMIQKSPSSTIGGTVSGVSGASGIGDGSSTSGSGSGLGSSTYVSRNESMSGLVSSSTSLSSRPSTPPKGANKGSHLLPVPYRNSKLTHLLKDSLGGNSKTTMITTIRSGLDYIKQTEMSLMYASRAKKIVNTTEINLHSNMSESSIHAVATEIDRLKRSLGEKSYELERLVMIMGKKASLDNENLLRQQLLTL
jgi:kinesin family protein 11